MAYSLDNHVSPSFDGPDINPFAHLETEVALDGADIAEIIEEDRTDKIEIYPEYAHLIEEASKIATIHTLGATFDAAILLGVDQALATSIMNKAIELLRARKLY